MPSAARPAGTSRALERAFEGLPPGLRQDLIEAFNSIVRNYRERRWEPAELNGGKFAEAAYSVLIGRLDGSYPGRASKPPNMVLACRELEQRRTGDRSFRILIPRALVALYEIRNNRGAGHAGGELSPNEMDASIVLAMAKWVMSELVRCLHSLPTREASAIVETLTEREFSLIWSANGTKRVLDTKLSRKQQLLLLLYSQADGEATEDELVRWLEVANVNYFRRDVLRTLHKARLIEFDSARKSIKLLPPGISSAEDLIGRL